MKKLVLLMIIGIMLSISLLVGVSYALWSNTHVQEGQGVVESGCFSTDFTEVNSISLSNSYPISDSKGMESKPYQFTITNTCSVDAKYEVNFEVLGSSTLSSDYVKLAIGSKKDILSNYESKSTTIDGAIGSNNIANGWLKPEESITYDLRLWIDEETTLEQGEGKGLSGKVVVVSVGDELNDSLISLLLEQYKEENEVGLVKDSENPNLYYYKGTNEEVANNFLWYGGHQWRVLEFDTEAKTLTLITQQPLTSINLNDSLWGNATDYENSFLNKWLKNTFLGNLNDNIKENIITKDFYVGNKDNITSVIFNYSVGLLDNNQYLRAGGANSFLDIKDYWWLGNTAGGSEFARINAVGEIEASTLHNGGGIRPSIVINDISINAGNGTLKNSYKIDKGVTAIADVQIGEYVSLKYSGSDNECGLDDECVFRVVSRDDDSVKIILNGLLNESSQFGNNSIISKNHLVYTKLQKFVSGFNSNLLYSFDKTFYIGDYPWVSNSGLDYEMIKDEIFESNIGLPMVGDIFSGNDIDLGTELFKNFIDVKSVENPYISNSYWLINRQDATMVRYINHAGGMGLDSFNSSFGVRPVIFLKNTLQFTGGSGTAQDPYTLD